MAACAEESLPFLLATRRFDQARKALVKVASLNGVTGVEKEIDEGLKISSSAPAELVGQKVM